MESLEVQLVVLLRKKTMAIKAVVVNKHGDPTFMVLQKTFE
jgi:hypothetical protein